MNKTIPALYAALMLSSSAAHAVDLTSHVLGVGAVTEFSGLSSTLVPAQLSVRAPSLHPRLMAGVLLGFAAGPGVTVVPGLRVDWVLIPEAHMNLSVGGAASVIVGSEGFGGVKYRVGPSVELFHGDWPNLGLLLDVGFAGAVGTGGLDFTSAVQTSVSAFGAAGLHYYF